VSGDGRIDTRALRQTFGQFATGVTIVTCLGPARELVGMTANSFSSVSLDPPLVLWSLDRSARSFAAFAAAREFAFSVLAQHQAELSNRFAIPGADKFAGVDWTPGHGGVPLIAGAAAHIECVHHAAFDGGDHLIVVGRVTRFVRFEERALVFAHGRYGVVAPHPGTLSSSERDAAEMHPYDDFLVPLLFRAYNHMFRAFSDTLAAEDATGAQMRVLSILAAGGPTGEADLLTRTMLSRSSFEEARQALLAAGLVTVERTTSSITSAGRARLAALLREAAKLERSSAGPLDATEIELLRDLLRKLVRHHDAAL